MDGFLQIGIEALQGAVYARRAQTLNNKNYFVFNKMVDCFNVNLDSLNKDDLIGQLCLVMSLKRRDFPLP